MKISYNWLKQYINIDKSPEEVGEILTNTGLEVEVIEKVSSIKGGLQGIVVGEVLTCEKHPNADKLSVTTVNVGGEKPLHIVCGAPNVAAGQKVPVATIGTTLYSGDESFVIKKSKLRGELSEGMICAEDELGLGNSHDGIMVLSDDLVPGTEAKTVFDVEEDVVFEIGLTPNRSDAMSHIGVARDLKAAVNFLENKPSLSLNIQDVSDFKVDNHDLEIDIKVEDTKACPRYMGVTMTNLKVEESPKWLKNKLIAIGLQPINNLVDISNFVLMETGQPLHFFDADKVVGNTVRVKKLTTGTLFYTLDGVERKLTENDLMICDDNSTPMCLAGIFGGQDSGVSNTTTRLFIECAYFDAPTIRKSSKHHALQTDASFRYERGADPNILPYALKRAVQLIKEISGGQISSEIIDIYPQKIENKKVKVSPTRINDLIGQDIPTETIINILENLEITILEQNADELLLEVPTYRVDVTREADIVEEIIRIYGFNNITFTEKINSSLSYPPTPEPDKVRNIISDFLSSQGFYEIMNNSLTKGSYLKDLTSFSEKNSVKILNPLSSELDVLRQTLLFAGLESVAYNINRKQENIRMYEFGKSYTFDESQNQSEDDLKPYSEKQLLSIIISGKKTLESWEGKSVPSDFFTLKQKVVSVLERIGVKTQEIEQAYFSNDIFEEGLTLSVNKKQFAVLGQVNGKISAKMDIKQTVYFAELDWDLILDYVSKQKVSYTPIPKFPEVRRDLALLVADEITYKELEDIAWKQKGNWLKRVNLFDVFKSDALEKGTKSYALSFVLQKEESTLKDKEIDKWMNKLISAYQKNVNAKVR